MENWQLRQKQSLPLEVKIEMSKRKIREWLEHWDNECYVSFSGGKDSTVLLDLVRQVDKNIPAVFSNTGLEYPEIVSFVRSFENIEIVKPKFKFKDVLDKHGYPVISKISARCINDLQNPTDKNVATRHARLTGFNKNGVHSPASMLAKKWLYLVDAPFKISDRCCEELKKKPFREYGKRTGKKPFNGTMASDSQQRARGYLKSGCNMFDAKMPISKPLSFWMEQDIWDYIKKYKLPYSKIYDMGATRTGCFACMFGVHLEKGENRFQRMKKNHPKHYKYCIEKLEIGKVLDFIGVTY